MFTRLYAKTNVYLTLNFLAICMSQAAPNIINKYKAHLLAKSFPIRRGLPIYFLQGTFFVTFLLEPISMLFLTAEDIL
jgi:hypothetical protein